MQEKIPGGLIIVDPPYSRSKPQKIHQVQKVRRRSVIQRARLKRDEKKEHPLETEAKIWGGRAWWAEPTRGAVGARKRPLSALDARLRRARACERDKTIGLLCVVFSHDLVSLLNVREPWDYVVKPKDFSGYFKSILGYPILSRTPILVPRPNDFNPCGLRQSGLIFSFFFKLLFALLAS